MKKRRSPSPPPEPVPSPPRRSLDMLQRVSIVAAIVAKRLHPRDVAAPSKTHDGEKRVS